MIYRYRIKRFSQTQQREYGMLTDTAGAVVNGARDMTGTAISGTGKMLDSGLGKTAGFIGGAALAPTVGASVGSKIGAGIGSIAGPLGTVAGGIVGGGLGMLAAPFVGAKAAGVAGKALKDAGDAIHT